MDQKILIIGTKEGIFVSQTVRQSDGTWIEPHNASFIRIESAIRYAEQIFKMNDKVKK